MHVTVTALKLGQIFKFWVHFVEIISNIKNLIFQVTLQSSEDCKLSEIICLQKARETTCWFAPYCPVVPLSTANNVLRRYFINKIEQLTEFTISNLQ
jgi:hypothetical protein